MTFDICKTFASVVAQSSDAISIQMLGREITYLELDQWSNGVASTLIGLPNAAEQSVAIASRNRLNVIVAMLGALKAGVVFSFVDPDLPTPRRNALMGLLNPVAVLVDSCDNGELQLPVDIGAAFIEIDNVPHVKDVVYRDRDADAPCYVYFTSGSTGEPKGVVGRYKAIGHFAAWEVEELGLDHTVRTSQLTNPSFDAILRDIFTPLSVGGRICIAPIDIKAEGVRFARWLSDSGVTLLHTLPSSLRVLMRAVQAEGVFLENLKHVCVAGEALLPVDVEWFFRLFNNRVELRNLYGPTETTMVKLCHRVQREDAYKATVPIGKPIQGARAVVLDDRLKPVGKGVLGEIFIRTPFRSLGYLNRPDLTAKVFIANPLTDDPADIIYRTGDLGRMLIDGALEFAGRRDRQVKIDGVRVELEEIENIIRKSPAVVDVAVTYTSNDEDRGELVAYIVLDFEMSTDELRKFLLSRVHSTMLPSKFIVVPSLPRTVTGKIDFGKLPSPSNMEVDAPYIAPRNPLEEAVATIWIELLHLDKVSIDAHFFSLGGHSLVAMQVLSRIEATLSINISVRDFLVQPTVRGLAEKISEQMVAFIEMNGDEFDYVAGRKDEESARGDNI